VLCFSAALGAQQPQVAPDWVLDRVEHQEAIAPDSHLKLTNLYGDLRIRAGREGEIYWLANTQRHRADPRRFALALVEGTRSEGTAEQELHITFEAPSPPSRPGAAGEHDGSLEPQQAWEKRRLDITVIVPASALVDAETRSGLLEARGVAKLGILRSVHGDIRVRGAGELDSKTEHGAQLIQFRPLQPGDTATITSTTGKITVEFPDELEFIAEVRTRGTLTTDYSLELERDRESGLKRAVAGDKGAEITIQSESGPIELLVSPVRWETPDDPDRE
jgi:hypothetical protein